MNARKKSITSLAVTMMLLVIATDGVKSFQCPSLRSSYCNRSPIIALRQSSSSSSDNGETNEEEDESQQVKVNGENLISVDTNSNNMKNDEEDEEGADDDDTITQALDTAEKSFINYTFLKPDSLLWKKRILSYRSYAKEDAFRNPLKLPVLEDLMMNIPTPDESFFLSIPGTGIICVIAFIIFPLIAGNLAVFVDMPPEQLDSITSKFVPGVAVLYGTFISTTLSILYRRQQVIQDSVAKETALLSLMLQNFLVLFNKTINRERLVESSQLIADQVQILLRESRGGEYLTMIYKDPYTKMLSMISDEEERLYHEDNNGSFLGKGPVLGSSRDTLKDLRQTRADRLSSEALALPPTHFTILSGLTFLILLGYVISVLPAIEEVGFVPLESSLLFGILSSLYSFFYAVACDLNDPYKGVFQVRRGSSATHLLEIRQIIQSHPNLKNGEISFVSLDEEVVKFHPELSEVWFQQQDK